MSDTYTVLQNLVNAVMFKDATSRTKFKADVAYEDAVENDPGPSVTGMQFSPESTAAFEARYDAYLAEYLAAKVQADAYAAASAHLAAINAAEWSPWPTPIEERFGDEA